MPYPIPGVNSPESEADPWISVDGRHLVFISNRTGTYQLWEVRR